MKKTILLWCILFISCKGGVRQEIYIENLSVANVFYVVHSNSIPTIDEINQIKPWSDERILEHHKHLYFENKSDSLENATSLKASFLVAKGKTHLVFSSKGIEIFNDKESIKEQISNYFNDTLRVSIIKEEDLLNHSEAEIIEKKLYKPFLKLTDKDIKEDILTFIYK